MERSDLLSSYSVRHLPSNFDIETMTKALQAKQPPGQLGKPSVEHEDVDG